MDNIINNLKGIANNNYTNSFINSYKEPITQNEWLTKWNKNSSQVLNNLNDNEVEILYKFIKTIAGMGFTTSILNKHLKQKKGIFIGGSKKKVSKKKIIKKKVSKKKISKKKKI